MKRAISHFLMAAPDKMLRRTMLAVSEQNTVIQLFSLDDAQSETAATTFYDGIISAGIVSLHIRAYSIAQLPEDYLYINIRESIHRNIDFKNRTLILDAHTENPAEFTFYLQEAFNSLSQLNIADIITATCYTPALLCNFDNDIKPGNSVQATLWKNCNLPERKLTANTSVANLY